ncbi:MAG: hypothetical protein ACE5EY_14635, partial [Anaerolineae bacterium]
MRNFKQIWIVGLVATFLIVFVPITLFVSADEPNTNDPWQNVPQALAHTDHTPLIEGEFATGQEVTKACLECHEEAAHQVMDTVHWTWESEPV